MFDYNRGYADDLEASGPMTLERAPKVSYYFFRTQRDADQTSPLYEAGAEVFIASYWQLDSTTDVCVYGNVDEVELLLNGRSVARQRPDSDQCPIICGIRRLRSITLGGGLRSPLRCYYITNRSIIR
jgi:beta-galactosidase